MDHPFQQETLHKVRAYLLQQEETIAVAESVTAGFMQLAFSTVADAMKLFQGGITTYNLGQKYHHLRVEPTHAFACNCVSEKVAVQMATQVCTLFRSDWGISITGFAAPVPESSQQLYAFYAIVHSGKVLRSGRVVPVGEDPFSIQRWYVNEVLNILAEAMNA